MSLGKELVAVLDDLVGAADEVHVVFLQEPRHHIGAKGEGYSTVIFAPPGNVLVGVGPKKIAKEATVGNLVRKKKPRQLKAGQGSE